MPKLTKNPFQQTGPLDFCWPGSQPSCFSSHAQTWFCLCRENLIQHFCGEFVVGQVHNPSLAPLMHPRDRPWVDWQWEVYHLHPGLLFNPFRIMSDPWDKDKDKGMSITYMRLSLSPFKDCPHGLFLHKHFGPLFSILDFLFFYSHSCFHLSHFSNVQEGPDDSWNIPPNVINTYCYIMWVQDTFKWKVKSKENFSQVNLHPPQAAGRWGAGRKRGRTRSRSVQPKVCIFRFVTLKKDGVNVFWWWNFSFYWYLFCNWQ